MNYFNNKIILITGATSGIGKALSEQFFAPTVTLLLVGRNKTALQQLQQQGTQRGAKVLFFEADLQHMTEVEKLAKNVFSAVTHLDVLINNAGISQRSLASETSELVDRQIMELNFFSPIKLTKLLWPLLTKSTHANVVNISSVTGTFGFPQRSAYAASKHAMEGFFQSWMLENDVRHVHFTTVAPGRINTNISVHALTSDGSTHQQIDEGQAKGISAQVCASQITKAIRHNKAKVYIVKQERILLLLNRFFPSFFVYLVKKLGLK